MLGAMSVLDPAGAGLGCASDEHSRAVVAAGVAKMVDALDLGSSDANRGGSNPPARTSPAPNAGGVRRIELWSVSIL